MKGFPNQVSDLDTLASALHVLIELNDGGRNPKDDGVFGEALIRRGVLRTGYTPILVEKYLAEQKAKKRKSDQSYRTRARGLREIFRVLGLIDDSEIEIEVKPAGRRIAALAGKSLTSGTIRLWRSVILDMTHDGGDGQISHPYQVLLRLVAKRPGITRAKCALALEARDDSGAELERIAKLSDLEEAAILKEIGESRANWDNAKKILPRFAEELGDVQKVGNKLLLGDAPGVVKEFPVEPEGGASAGGPRKSRSSSAVSAESIARSGTTEDWDEAVDLTESELDAEAIKASKAKIRARLRRHNLIVKKAALMLEAEGAELLENPFDCLACFPDEVLLIEVKSLDGTERDEVVRVRDALAKLLYYESFVTKPLVKKRAVRKVACFEQRISEAHIDWLQSIDIHVIWSTDRGFGGTAIAAEELRGHLGF
jgi:hypothetical protein